MNLGLHGQQSDCNEQACRQAHRANARLKEPCVRVCAGTFVLCKHAFAAVSSKTERTTFAWMPMTSLCAPCEVC